MKNDYRRLAYASGYQSPRLRVGLSAASLTRLRVGLSAASLTRRVISRLAYTSGYQSPRSRAHASGYQPPRLRVGLSAASLTRRVISAWHERPALESMVETHMPLRIPGRELFKTQCADCRSFDDRSDFNGAPSNNIASVSFNECRISDFVHENLPESSIQDRRPQSCASCSTSLGCSWWGEHPFGLQLDSRCQTIHLADEDDRRVCNRCWNGSDWHDRFYVQSSQRSIRVHGNRRFIGIWQS